MPMIRDFWRGLTTPDAVVVRIAAALLLVTLVGLSVAAAGVRRRIEAGAVDWRPMPDDVGRASVLAVRGAAREADATARTFVFVGPSAMRYWLPPEDEADAVATAAAGAPTRVLRMCGPRLSMASAAALIDRFGGDFTGWFVIGVTRQSIGRRLAEKDLRLLRRDSQAVGFESEVLRRSAAFLGYPQEPATGWELWDHRRFFYHRLLQPVSGLRWAMLRGRQGEPPAGLRSTRPEDDGADPLDLGSLERHLAVLKEVAEGVRGGRAQFAIVETPWANQFNPAMQSPEWRRDEAAYRRRTREWSEENGVPWITAPAEFQATSADFLDGRHLGSPHLRRRFLETVVHELSSR